MIEREAPGLRRGDARRIARAHRDVDDLARRRRDPRLTLIVNFPGNPPAIEQAGAALERAIPHALALLSGKRGHPHR